MTMRWLRRLLRPKPARRTMCAQRAYDRWIAARDKREPAFSMYYAELDSEERAARAYRDSAKRLAAATARWQRERLTSARDTATAS